MFRDAYNIPLIARDASEVFLRELDGVTDPEQKRKTIGRLFIDVFQEEADKIKDARFLAQGTLYPDVIESVSFTGGPRSEEHTSELQSLMRISYAVFCLKKKKNIKK